MAVIRRLNGELAIGTGRMRPSRARNVPFLRGLVAWFVESPLENQWAADKLGAELEREEAGEEPPPRDYRGSVPPAEREELPPPRTRRLVPMLIAFVLSQAFPQLVAHLSLRAAGIGLTPASAAFQASISASTLVLFVVYFLVARRVEDLRRVFGYGAAIKQAMWAARTTDERSITTLSRHPPWHPRGTAFGLALGLLLLPLLAALVLGFVPLAHEDSFAAQAVACAVRVSLIPLVIPVVDELQRAIESAGHRSAVRVVFAPFIAVERLVAMPPDDEQLAIAATALRELEKLHGS